GRPLGFPDCPGLNPFAIARALLGSARPRDRFAPLRAFDGLDGLALERAPSLHEELARVVALALGRSQGLVAQPERERRGAVVEVGHARSQVRHDVLLRLGLPHALDRRIEFADVVLDAGAHALALAADVP